MRTLDILLLVVVTVCFISQSSSNPCKHVTCRDPDYECRAVRICDVTGSCDKTLGACGPRDTRYSPCAYGRPVLDLSGQAMSCRDVNTTCPVGFFCQNQHCCPSQDFHQVLPTCVGGSPFGSQVSSAGQELTLCIDGCHGDADCHENGQTCCISACNSQCRGPTIEATTQTTIARPTTVANVFPVTSPSSDSTGQPTNPETRPNPQTLTDANPRNGPNFSVNASSAEQIKEQTTVSPRDNPETPAEPSMGLGSNPRDSSSGPVRAPSIVQNAMTTPGPDALRVGPQEGPDGDNNNNNSNNNNNGNIPNPALFHDQKAGQCPVQPKLTICGQRPCTRDDQCPGPTKCCPTHCGLICVTPKDTTDRLNKLQRNIFQDIGFGSPRQFGQSQDATNPEVFGTTLKKYGLDFALPGTRSGQQNSLGSKKFGFTAPKTYAGLYKPQSGPLYSYGFRPGTSVPIVGSLLNKDGGHSPTVGSKPDNGVAKDNQQSYDQSNTILGFRLPFPNRQRPFSVGSGQFTDNSSGGKSASTSTSTFRFPTYSHSQGSNSLGSFPAYGPNGFEASTSGLNYGRLDPGSFGGIDKSDYAKLGLDYPADTNGMDGSSSSGGTLKAS